MDMDVSDIDFIIDLFWIIGIWEVCMNFCCFLDVFFFFDLDIIYKYLFVGDYKEEYLEFFNFLEIIR